MDELYELTLEEIALVEIETPSGKRPEVRAVWIVDRGDDIPRLVTAYPH